MGIIRFLGAAYSIYLFRRVCHGGCSSGIKRLVKGFPGLPLMLIICYGLFMLSFCIDIFFVG